MPARPPRRPRRTARCGSAARTGQRSGFLRRSPSTAGCKPAEGPFCCRLGAPLDQSRRAGDPPWITPTTWYSKVREFATGTLRMNGDPEFPPTAAQSVSNSRAVSLRTEHCGWISAASHHTFPPGQKTLLHAAPFGTGFGLVRLRSRPYPPSETENGVRRRRIAELERRVARDRGLEMGDRPVERRDVAARTDHCPIDRDRGPCDRRMVVREEGEPLLPAPVCDVRDAMARGQQKALRDQGRRTAVVQVPDRSPGLREGRRHLDPRVAPVRGAEDLGRRWGGAPDRQQEEEGDDPTVLGQHDHEPFAVPPS